jgi:iron complex outermembrane receptor protein
VSASVGAQQTPAAPEGSASQPAALEEIVVTSQRRVENAQAVAVAVTALSGDDLNAKAVTRVADLQFASPSLSVTDAGLTQA